MQALWGEDPFYDIMIKANEVKSGPENLGYDLYIYFWGNHLCLDFQTHFFISTLQVKTYVCIFGHAS